MDGFIHYAPSFQQLQAAAASLALLSICVSQASWQLARSLPDRPSASTPSPCEWGYKNRRFYICSCSTIDVGTGNLTLFRPKIFSQNVVLAGSRTLLGAKSDGFCIENKTFSINYNMAEFLERGIYCRLTSKLLGDSNKGIRKKLLPGWWK